MRLRLALASLALLAALALTAAAVWTRAAWWPWLFPSPSAEEAGDHDTHAHGSPDRVRLSPQGRANLNLDVQPLQLRAYWRTIQVPGTVVDRPGLSDRGVAAPIAGVVRQIHAVPGDTVRPGDPLFTLRLLSESLQTSQTELYKAARDLQIAREQRARLEKAAQAGALPEARLIEFENQERRYSAAVQAYRQDLAARGLTSEQIDAAAAGKFVTETVIRAPERAGVKPAEEGEKSAAEERVEYEVQDLKVNLGEQVQAGQALAYLASHQDLYIEGHGFKHEVPLLARAAQAGWPLEAVFAEEMESAWPPLANPLRIRHLANTVEVASQTFPFYVPLTNQFREYTAGGKTHRVWRFRPGQRVRLAVPVESLKGVFVLPAEAVVREGGEAYVFRQNGDYFDRRPVRVLHEDRRHVVVANDGSVNAGNYLAHQGASRLNRVLKSQASPDAGHGHHGHEH